MSTIGQILLIVPQDVYGASIALEKVCLLYVSQIKQALGISCVQTEVSSLRFAGDQYTFGRYTYNSLWQSNQYLLNKIFSIRL